MTLGSAYPSGGGEVYTSAEKTKLAGIEAAATADQTGAEIKLAYEGEANTNAYTDTEKTKLAGVEAAATADQTGAEIKLAYEGEANTNAYTDAEKTKVGNITVTGAVDLDAIDTRVSALDAAVVLQGTWNASSGLFPGGGTAQAGDSWIVSVAGTVDSVSFAQNDRVIAIADNAATGTYAANWHKADYTDQVLSVNSQTGAVVLDADDIDDTSTTNKFATAAEKTKLGNIAVTQAVDLDTMESDIATNASDIAGKEPLGEQTAINTQTGTSYTLALADKGKMVTLSNALAITLTIPTNASVAFPVKTRIDIAQLGAGLVTVGGAGVTIRSLGSALSLGGQYAGASLLKIGTDEWLLAGSLQ